MMLGLLESSQVFLDMLPEFVIGVLHELLRDVFLIALPVVLSHLASILVLIKI